MSEKTLQKVLIIRLSSIGDIILTTPMLRVLKSVYPNCELHYVTRREFGELLQHDPHIDRLIQIDAEEGRTGLRAMNLLLVREEYDAVFDLHNNFRSRVLRNGLSSHIHRVHKRGLRRLLLVKAHINRYQNAVAVPDRYIETAADYGLLPDNDGPELFLTNDIRMSARMKLRAAGIDPAVPSIGLCPGAKHFTKRWPSEHFASLVKDESLHGEQIVIFGGDDDAQTAAAIRQTSLARIHDMTGRLTLLETAAAMEHCHSLVTNDSGLMHMATAMKRPVVALFGSTVREFGFFPYHSLSTVLEVADLSCRPCTHIGRASCPKGHFNCMQRITPGSVIEALNIFSHPDFR